MSKKAPAAARSAAALAGFLVVAALQLTVVLLALGLVLSALPGALALRIGVPLSLATFGALGYATWRALHTRHRVPAGVAVSREQAPLLWRAVDAAAAAARVPAPDGLTIVADATAALGERTRLLGVIGGRRDLYLGLPLLQALEPDRLAAIVAHELGHGSPLSGRWAPLAYRGRVAVGRTVPRITRRNVAGAVLRAYAGFYRRIDAPVSREQEFTADRIAAGHAGIEATVAALRDLPALAGMQRLFHAEYVGPGWQAGYVPDDVFGGLLRVLAARTTEMSLLRSREPEPTGPWDTHPPLSERLAALTALAASSRPSAAGPLSSSSSAGPLSSPSSAGLPSSSSSAGLPSSSSSAGPLSSPSSAGLPSSSSSASPLSSAGASSSATDMLSGSSSATGLPSAPSPAAGAPSVPSAAVGASSGPSSGAGMSSASAFAGGVPSTSASSADVSPGGPSANGPAGPFASAGGSLPPSPAASEASAPTADGLISDISGSSGISSVDKPVDGPALASGNAVSGGPGGGSIGSPGGGSRGESGGGSAPELVPDLPGLGRALQAVAYPPRGRAVVSWDEALSVARTSEMEREAEAALAAISRAVGITVPDAGQLLTLAADGRLRAATATLFPDAPPEEATARIVELLALMLALAALRSGVARWRHSWTGAAEVVAVDGGYLDLAELAAAAADPETTEAVRAYLTEAGVDLSTAAADPGSARAQVLGGLVNLSADGERTDILITDLGLLLVPGLPRSRGHESKRRLTRIAADGVPAGAVLPPGPANSGTSSGPTVGAASSGSAGSAASSGSAGSTASSPSAGGAFSSPVGGATPSAGRHATDAAASVPGPGVDAVGGAGSGSGVDAATSANDPASRTEAGEFPGEVSAAGRTAPDSTATGSARGAQPSTVGAGVTVPLPAGGRFLPFADVAGVTAMPGRRKGWLIGLRGGGELALRPALDADELPGGWEAWERAVNFLAGTR